METASFLYSIRKSAIYGKGIRMNVNGLVSLTDLHRPAGGAGAKHPNKWFTNDSTEEFILQVMRKFKLQKSELTSVKRGHRGGTWAHRQITLAYAQRLPPDCTWFATTYSCSSSNLTLLDLFCSLRTNHQDITRTQHLHLNV